MLTIRKILELTNGTILTGNNSLNSEVKKGFASDLMSDVLKIDESELLLITGLCNLQTMRTAEMADINFIIFVRNKKPTLEMIDLANENNVAILMTTFSMLKTSALLVSAGLKPVY